MSSRDASRHLVPVPAGEPLRVNAAGRAPVVDENVLALLMGALIAQLRSIHPADPDAAGAAAERRGVVGHPDKHTFSVAEAAELLGISRALAYDLVRSGELASVRLGRRIVVPRRALERLLESAMDGRYLPARRGPVLERATDDGTPR